MKTIALVGCGRISRRHIEAIQATEGVEIAAVCDILPERARKCAEELSVPWTTDFRKLPPVDFAAVLTPSGNHPEHAAAIAESTGIGGILCEKPISLTMREAYHLFSRIDRTGKRLLPIYQNRYNPLVILLKELVDSGRLGKLYQFICNVLWNRDNDYFSIDWHGTREFDGGVLYTQASHYVDLLHYLFGEIAESKGIGGCRRNLEVFDAVSATMRFRNGIVGSLNATVDVFEKNYQTEFTLIAENGTIRLSGTNLNRIDFWNVRDLARPDMDFTLDHIYGKGHDQLYRYLAEERWEMFPSREDVLSGIRLMEMLSY
ncbi:Gfo/Idh/MocA family protein [Victivallis vadensis]|uniref:Gfo/Idh/MocA family protein n=1 Tax=Victivallis vadensis TaxID=172901 RepID=UPI0023F01A3D|nr:Gfo/Idh/MocA family oxidoreductase [Victivallis vadensis]